MTNRERIEAYFDNNLSTTERESLLRDIESDPSLKAEFEFQQEVINGIKAYRKEELIARLDNVQVASIGNATLTKILGAIGLAAIVSGGLFWFYGTDNNERIESENSIEISEEPKTGTEATEEVADEANMPVEVIEKAVEETESPGAPVEETVSTAQTKDVTPDIVIPDVVEPDSDAITALDDSHEAPESMKTEAVSVTSTANIEIKIDKRYDFHYQVIDGDLTLFGDFDDSTFEVIELKTNLGIKLYLYYNKLYYELKSDTEEIRPLEPVSDNVLVEELNKRRQ